ncbi:hypothetical protein RDI86_02335 [Cellulosimicrobium sp. XJ-DQ-B-000]|uniref:phage tail fiber protein n=1 Tax=Cellulosimicrobium sp. XJ-DQ-B-000 TaxID=3072182 RepID=UPI002807FEC6|nr:hypothetical protein [Cellulosimicrobium sp. XJ-DQ-B-000]MDQ8040680.1 hypothetical protein [Cellulosimicrobium sp. XJ-DQ-B-000]
MAASSALLNALAADAASLITHVGLVNAAGTELTGGSYARQPVTAAASGAIVLVASDKTFEVAAGTTVAGWRAFDAATGGTSWGGGDLTAESYTGAGQYVLRGADTGFTISASA